MGFETGKGLEVLGLQEDYETSLWDLKPSLYCINSNFPNIMRHPYGI